MRKADKEDATAFFSIKQQLPMPGDQETATGGFLLGTDVDTYAFYIQAAHCLVAENEGGVKGFGIIFPDGIIKNSGLWQKRHEANWLVDITNLESRTLCYFEQLAFLPGYRKWAPVLCYQLLKKVFDGGCEFMVTTIVRKPVHNKAAIPFITAVGGELIGNIDEAYANIGSINSDVYGIDRDAFYKKTVEHDLYNHLVNNLRIH